MICQLFNIRRPGILLLNFFFSYTKHEVIGDGRILLLILLKQDSISDLIRSFASVRLIHADTGIDILINKT